MKDYLDCLKSIDRDYLKNAQDHGFWIEENSSSLYSPYFGEGILISIPVARLDEERNRLEFLRENDSEQDSERYRMAESFRNILTGLAVFDCNYQDCIKAEDDLSRFLQPLYERKLLTAPKRTQQPRKPGQDRPSE